MRRVNLSGMKTHKKHRVAVAVLLLCLAAGLAQAQDPDAAPKAFIDGTGPGWQPLAEKDFVNVNCEKDTWTWKDGLISCTGTPTGVIRSDKPYTNFELVVQWRHLKPAGNSGVFIWGSEASLKDLAPGKLPHGIEVQVLDNAYKDRVEQSGRKADFFTTHGDVFPTGTAKMTPFPPTSPNGSRSFPRKNLSKSAGEWNHYYIRAINGEVRLWVNGEEVSGGINCNPRSGYLCLESEGSPIEFKGLRVRELP
jgi:hypothetical protein